VNFILKAITFALADGVFRLTFKRSGTVLSVQTGLSVSSGFTGF
jgi:hypothetical protein